MLGDQLPVTPDPITGASYYVLKRHTLVHTTDIDGIYVVMAGNPYIGYSWQNGNVHANRQDIEPAIIADFKNFNIDISGYV